MLVTKKLGKLVEKVYISIFSVTLSCFYIGLALYMSIRIVIF